jgi:fermentation-respiration switch protein FrsA (DUF1100 family)
VKAQPNQQQTNFGSSAKTLWVAVVALILATAMLSAPPASAQTIATGSFQLYSSSGGVFILTGASNATSGFIARGSINNEGGGYIDLFCNPCGNLLPINITAFGSAFGGGSAVTWLPTVQFPALDWYGLHPGGESGLAFNGPDIPLTGAGVYTGPVSYFAVLCGQIPGHDLFCDFNVPPQSGSGHVVVHIAQDPQTGFLYTTSATYLIP